MKTITKDFINYLDKTFGSMSSKTSVISLKYDDIGNRLILKLDCDCSKQDFLHKIGDYIEYRNNDEETNWIINKIIIEFT